MSSHRKPQSHDPSSGNGGATPCGVLQPEAATSVCLMGWPAGPEAAKSLDSLFKAVESYRTTESKGTVRREETGERGPSGPWCLQT